MTRTSWLRLATTIFAAACGGRRLPLTELGRVTRIEVRNPVGADTAHVITDPQRVQRAVDAVRALRSGWDTSWHTLPAGQVAALFYQDTLLVGVLWLGQNYVMARGRGTTLIRHARPDELAPVAGALELPVKVIPVPVGGRAVH